MSSKDEAMSLAINYKSTYKEYVFKANRAYSQYFEAIGLANKAEAKHYYYKRKAKKAYSQYEYYRGQANISTSSRHYKYLRMSRVAYSEYETFNSRAAKEQRKYDRHCSHIKKYLQEYEDNRKMAIKYHREWKSLTQ